MRFGAFVLVLVAVSVFRPARAQDPPPDPAWKAGAYHLARGDYQKALESLSGAVASGNSSAAELNLLGIAEMMSGRHEAALDTFRRALESDPKLIEARMNRGITWLKLGRYDRANGEFEIVYEQTTALRPVAAMHHALASDGAGKLEEAALWAERAVKEDPSFDEAVLYLGVIREKLRDYQAAGKAYKDYLARRPESVVARLRFGTVALASGHQATALKYFREVVSMAPGTPEAMEATKFLVMWE